MTLRPALPDIIGLLYWGVRYTHSGQEKLLEVTHEP